MKIKISGLEAEGKPAELALFVLKLNQAAQMLEDEEHSDMMLREIADEIWRAVQNGGEG